MDGQEAYATPKSENLRYASDVLQWFSGAEPIYDGASGLNHCRIEEDYGGCGFLQPAAKKRRLGADQIKSLERSFDDDNKLEPERKLQLAKDLGLQPRQVAVWFQNRRARSRTKNLEKDYGALKSRFDSLSADHERLLAEKSRLEKEVMSLKEKLQIGETEKQEAVHVVKPEELSGKLLSDSKVEEVASSVRSGVFDSDSPYFAEADGRVWLEPADSSSRVLEGDDISLPELEESGSIFTAQDQQHFWSWPY